MINKIRSINLWQSIKISPFVLGIMALTPSIAAAVPPKIWTAWQPTTLNASQCINRAEMAVRNNGYSQNLEIFGTGATAGVYGESGQYSVTVRCGINNGIVFFIAAGPSSTVASQQLSSLIRNF